MPTSHVGTPATGLLVAVGTMLVTALLVLWLVGALQADDPPAYRGAVVVGADEEPRPTPYWRFRDEWLTPRPKG